MEPLTREWVDKADADAVAFEHLFGLGDPRLADVIAFHAQQCAEKYLKAVLQQSRQSVPRNHDLSVLLDLAVASASGRETWRADLDFLADFAVGVRYPGLSTDWDTAAEAVARARRFRAAARQALGLGNPPSTGPEASR
jgi:HEPN domain-containing protein